MGAIAEKNSDICVVTSDNPRSESPQAIIDDIKKGMEYAHPTFILREEAIEYAIAHANFLTDVVLIAGKGHETYQEILGVQHPFDDRMIAKKYAPKGDEHAFDGQELAQATRGSCMQTGPKGEICTDTRTLKKGD